MGGIDEAALDNLSLVTEMTKHIQVRASTPSQGASASVIGQFSPFFQWLLHVSNSLPSNWASLPSLSAKKKSWLCRL